MNRKFLSLLAVGALLLTACSTEKETEKETVKESILETQSTAEESVNETIIETKKEAETLKEVKVVEEDKDDEGEVIEVIKNDKEVADTFDKKLTEKMNKELSEYKVVLVSDGNNTVFDFPMENIQAVKEIESDLWTAYVVRFGNEKIGVLARLKETPVETVNLYEYTEDGILKDDSVESYQRAAEEVAESFFKED